MRIGRRADGTVPGICKEATNALPRLPAPVLPQLERATMFPGDDLRLTRAKTIQSGIMAAVVLLAVGAYALLTRACQDNPAPETASPAATAVER
jgi:hypothetical protein